MRVLMTADAMGGVWQYALELARGLEGSEVEILLAVMGGRLSPDRRQEVLRLSGVTVFERPFKLEWMQDPELDLERASRWLLDLADVFSADLIHVNGYYHAALPWRRPVIAVAHSCVVSWWKAVKQEPPPSSWDPYRIWVRQGLEMADMVVAPSAHMLSTLLQNYGTFGRARVIYNGRTLDSPPVRYKDPIVLGAGRIWDQAKNLDVLASAAHRIRWPIYIAGDVSHPDGSVPAPSLGDGARLLGRLTTKEVEDWMGRASIYCLPARYEPFGLTPLEAALSGCALVLSNIPTFREIWQGAADLVSPEDPVALAHSISEMIEDENRRERYAAAAQSRARQFTRRRMASSYLHLYGQLAATEAHESASMGERSDIAARFI